MAPPALMIQGTGSNVGKSLIVAGLCRAYARRGLKVRPFKAQNMSNNAAVAEGGGEIGRAQALQARAAGIAPSVHMNPVLLKPQSESGAQVVVQGARVATLAARDFGTLKARLMPRVMESFAALGAQADLIIAEGAGSPAETNLRAGDIANMGFAEAAGLPVVIVGDIDRGGVIASLVGTHAVLGEADRARIAGFIVNRFRGDPTLFADGATDIVRRTGWEALGVVPHFADAHRLPAEDSVDLAGRATCGGPIRVAVPVLGRIANFDDLDPLRLEPSVEVVLVEPGEAIPGDAALVLIGGSKSTLADLDLVRREGWDIDIAAHVRRGGMVIGLCAGYQMLGRMISDPEGVEGVAASVPGLGLLDVDTVLTTEKTTREVEGVHVDSGYPVHGYEIHLGQSDGRDRARPVLSIGDRTDGATSPGGRVIGTYVHGIFASDPFRRWLIGRLGGVGDPRLAYEDAIDATLDALADHLEASLDCDRLLEIAGSAQNRIASTA